MVGARLRELVATAPGAGELAGAGVGRGRSEHPVCGDEVAVDVRLHGGSIAELRWRVRGCPASHAVAAVAATTLPGCAPGAAQATLRRRLQELGDLGAHEGHAEAMFLRALQAACGAAAGPT